MGTPTEDARALADRLLTARDLVFLGGAGVSTESGIPDYRSARGLYHEDTGTFYSGAQLLSREFLEKRPDLHFSYYLGKLVHPEARPNPAHLALARLEELGLLTLVITQNIDGLHQQAGSRNVYEMHGSMWRNHCTVCGKPHELSHLLKDRQAVPRCLDCGGLVRPDTVLYGEALEKEPLKAAVRTVRNCDMLLVGGTSLAVNPARGLVKYFRGSHLVFMNRDETPLDRRAGLLIRHPLGEVLPLAVELFEKERKSVS